MHCTYRSDVISHFSLASLVVVLVGALPILIEAPSNVAEARSHALSLASVRFLPLRVTAVRPRETRSRLANLSLCESLTVASTRLHFTHRHAPPKVRTVRSPRPLTVNCSKPKIRAEVSGKNVRQSKLANSELLTRDSEKERERNGKV